ncbi:MAG TPA: hypothetical protein VEX13_13870 [Chloroflexia bacterium]|nr:hypothetical protein [Chloroflexia bacterium]
MSAERKSLVQRFFTSLVSPERAAEMEADSRRWMLQCPECGYERSFWDIGGIRYKAVGNQRNLMRCTNCGRRTWHKAYRREDPLPEDPAPLSAAATSTTSAATTMRRPRWLVWTLLLVPLAAVMICTFLGIFLLTTTLVQPIVNVGDNFMAALKTNNDTQAYALCAPDLQTELGSPAGISSLVVPDNRPTQWSWSTRSIRNGVGRLEGSFTSTDGKRGTVQITLSEADSDWKITSFRLTTNP